MIPSSKPRNRILIAEDDPVSARVLQSFLQKWGYEVISVADGSEALRVLERQDYPRLAILDWMMPGMEGTQICRAVRLETSRPYVYILLLTARTQREDVLIGLDSGADDYLTKPFDAQELRARLHVGERILDLQDSLIAAREELLFQATHDHLTGISNRGVVLNELRKEGSRQLREGGSFGIVMIDVDHFKFVNDKFGHICGDAVLREAASRMKTSLRPYDTVGRYGGEEFLIVAPACDAVGTLALAERIRKAIESQPIATDGGDVLITASLGVAVSNSSRRFDPETLLQLADDALYRAKIHGRNRSELAVIPPEDDSVPSLSKPAGLPAGSR